MTRLWDEVEQAKQVYVQRWVFALLVTFWIGTSVMLYERLGKMETKIEVLQVTVTKGGM
jgi:hypothetical protein